MRLVAVLSLPLFQMEGFARVLKLYLTALHMGMKDDELSELCKCITGIDVREASC